MRSWLIVLLRPRDKRPVGPSWQVFSVAADREVIGRHLSSGGNVGLVCCRESGAAVLDFDDSVAAQEMFSALGALRPTVLTGSGKIHVYVQWEEDLPAKLRWKGRVVGEVQRGPNQYVVMPPSVHPDTGRPYTWQLNPATTLPVLTDAWRKHLHSTGSDRPPFVTPGDTRGVLNEPWLGPAPEELIARALLQPGAKTRRAGIKFQCPGCRAEGRDRSRDNGFVARDGRWGCAVDPSHKAALRAVLVDRLPVIASRATIIVRPDPPIIVRPDIPVIRSDDFTDLPRGD